ncbi:MAG: DUF4381 family protein [Endozoicomonas sp.]
MHAFPEHHVGGLQGATWQQFLSETGKTSDFENNNSFSNERFNPEATLDTTNTYELTQRWVKKHHA